MSVDPTKYNIPIRHILSFRQQVFYAEELQREQDEEAEAEARARARAEEQEAWERSAFEQRSCEAEELEMVKQTSNLPDEAEEVAGPEGTDEGAVEVEQHVDAKSSLELARRLLRRAEIPAGSDDAETGIDDVEPQPHSEETADVPHLSAAEAEEGADPEVTEEGADEGEPSRSEEASTPSPLSAEEVEEGAHATPDARPSRLARKATPPARKPTKRKQAAKVASVRAPNRSRRRSHPVTAPPPPPLAPLLTSPALLPGEDPAEYADLLFRVVECVRPADAIEMMLVHDFVGRSWEVARYQRLKTALLTSRMPASLRLVLRELQVDDAERQALVRGWLMGDLKAKSLVRAHLAAAGWDESVIHARSFVTDHKTIEAIEGQLMTAETCRAVAWRQLIRHRDDLAHRFQRPPALIEAACSNIDEQAAEDA